MEQTTLWKEYETGKEYLESHNIFYKSARAHQFVDGDQWRELKVPKGFDAPPQLNILQPIMKSATALVGQNYMEMTYSPLNKTSHKEKYVAMCDALNKFAKDTWENLKMDARMWDVLEDAYITGDSLVYFYWDKDKISAEFLDNTSVLFADEHSPDIQKQPYLIIPQRRYVQEVREEAIANGLKEEQIQRIVAHQPEHENSQEKERNNLKVTVVTKLWKEKGIVHIARSTKEVLLQPATPLSVMANGSVQGLTYYPLAKYAWKPKRNSARGQGDIWDKIPNQIEINKGVYRFCQTVKSYAFPHKIFFKNVLSPQAIEKLDIPGSTIEVSALPGQGVDSIVRYLQPAAISPYAASIWRDLIVLTRELCGAGDNLENINPENASGAAINAAREAKVMNVNGQVAAYKQFIEDVALIWANLWQVYNQDSIYFRGEKILPQEFIKLSPSVRIDISPSTPYSKLVQEAELKALFEKNIITFEEYVYALNDNSSMPKGKLCEILEKRNQEKGEAFYGVSNV